ncbi:hypothetical protein WAF17_10100 [Bernardetia sp. ABR2-2B]|uniref:hypothetical protein n=1 Tax=Bernardetia sp. ABR2-2B TaxID=3127472 RepID=UPI0030CAF494
MKIFKISSFIFLFFSVILSSCVIGNMNSYQKRDRRVNVDESNIYDESKDIKRRNLFLRNGVVNQNFSEFVRTTKSIESPFFIDENLNLSLYSRLFIDTYNSYFDITNGINETILLAPKNNNRLYLIGKLDNMPNGITALLFYAFEGTNIQFTKLITFDELGNPIAHKNVQYHIKGSKDRLAQEGKTTFYYHPDNTIRCIDYKESSQGMIPKLGTIYKIQDNGSIKEIGILEMEN